MEKNFFSGVDVGASATKCVVIDENENILGFSIKRTSTNLGKLAQGVFDEAGESSEIPKEAVRYIVATGYGRENVNFANEMKTEISCHGRGGYHYFKHLDRGLAIVDIGGQDNKVIRLDKNGKMLNFRMNRKCAAGTGAFLEEIAHKLDIPLGNLDELARKATKDIELGSYCTVFTSTEILERIKDGETKENMVKGAFLSVAKRIMEMENLQGSVVITGGVIAFNSFIGEILEKELNVDIHIPPKPQLIGAYGASLIAKEHFLKNASGG